MKTKIRYTLTQPRLTPLYRRTETKQRESEPYDYHASTRTDVLFSGSLKAFAIAHPNLYELPCPVTWHDEAGKHTIERVTSKGYQYNLGSRVIVPRTKVDSGTARGSGMGNPNMHCHSQRTATHGW